MCIVSITIVFIITITILIIIFFFITSLPPAALPSCKHQRIHRSAWCCFPVACECPPDRFATCAGSSGHDFIPSRGKAFQTHHIHWQLVYHQQSKADLLQMLRKLLLPWCKTKTATFGSSLVASLEFPRVSRLLLDATCNHVDLPSGAHSAWGS